MLEFKMCLIKNSFESETQLDRSDAKWCCAVVSAFPDFVPVQGGVYRWGQYMPQWMKESWNNRNCYVLIGGSAKDKC